MTDEPNGNGAPGPAEMPVGEVDPNRLEGPRFDPHDDLEAVRAMLPPRSSPAPHFRTTLQDDVPYFLIRWTANFAAGGEFAEKVFQITGDHVYCESVLNTGAVYIKLGPQSNPWIRLRAGMTYRRRFGQLRLCSPDESGFEGSAGAHAVLYVSTGPLMVGDRIRQGIDNNLLGADLSPDGITNPPLTATTTPQSFLGPIFGTAYSDQHTPPSIGAVGGVVVIKNTDLVNTLYLSNVNGGGSGFGFPLGPGETFQATVAGRLAGDNGVALPLVFTKVGTCTYAFLLSPYEKDRFQDNADVSGGVN